MGIEPPAHDQSGLFTALTVFFELLLDAPLELLGNRYQSWRGGIVLLYQDGIYT